MARIRAAVVLVGYGMGAGAVLEAARRLPIETIGVVAIDALYDAESAPLALPHREAVAAYEENFAKACREAMAALAGLAGEPQESFAVRCATSPQIAIPLLRQMATYSAAAASSFVAAPVRGINAVRPATRVDINRRYAPTTMSRCSTSRVASRGTNFR